MGFDAHFVCSVVIFGMRSPIISIRRVDIRAPLFEVFQALGREFESVFLLESLEGPERLAEFSFLGFGPAYEVEVWGGLTRVRGGGSVEEFGGDPVETLRRVVKPSRKIAYAPRFVGGLVGYVSYEAAYLWEDIEARDKPGDGFPLMRLGLYQDALVYDHRNNTYYYCYTEEDRLHEITGALRDSGDPEPLSYTEPASNMGEDEFLGMVERGKEYIASGDVFQVVLSRRMVFKSRGSLLPFYLNLRRLNPSPYMYYLRMGDEEIVGSSPEMLVRVQGENLTTFPIAGTRPRQSDPRREEETDRELMKDEKERAEHVMLVDLARNDLGKVSEPGTVKVSEFMKLVKYSHVKHLVSCVESRLREGMDMYDAFKAVFPAGTVSGAPKPRAMEIIEELEPCRRGPYAGAVGYFSFTGCADFAITIRTLVRRGEETFIQAGAGIVWDSVPEREWMETQHKMAALLKALEMGDGR